MTIGLNKAVIRFGIAGLGIAGSDMISSLQKKDNIKITAASDINQDSLDDFSRDFGVETYLSVEEMCKSNNVDAIYIATPNHLHKEHVLMAAEHGKHTIVEKPMALTMEEADEMITATERNNVKMVLCHKRSFDPPIRKMRDILKSGELGQLRMIHNWHYNDWLYRPRTPDELDPSKGGGITLRQGSHHFDMIRFLGGGLLKSVRASVGVWDVHRRADGSYVAFLQFENGAVSTSVYNGYDHFHSAEISFGIGPDGKPYDEKNYAKARKALRCAGGLDGELALKKSKGYKKSKIQGKHANSYQPFFGFTVVSCDRGDIRQSPTGLYIYDNDKKREISLEEYESGRDAIVTELCEAVLMDKPIIHNGRWGKANLEVCLAVLDSAKSNKEIHLSYQNAVPGNY